MSRKSPPGVGWDLSLVVGVPSKDETSSSAGILPAGRAWRVKDHRRDQAVSKVPLERKRSGGAGSVSERTFPLASRNPALQV